MRDGGREEKREKKIEKRNYEEPPTLPSPFGQGSSEETPGRLFFVFVSLHEGFTFVYVGNFLYVGKVFFGFGLFFSRDLFYFFGRQSNREGSIDSC